MTLKWYRALFCLKRPARWQGVLQKSATRRLRSSSFSSPHQRQTYVGLPRVALFAFHVLRWLIPSFPAPLFFPQMENNVVITDYAQMDRVLREEREYLLGLCKKIAKSGYVYG